MNVLVGSCDRLFETITSEDQIGQGNVSRIAPAGSARIKCGGSVVPSYSVSDGKLCKPFKIMERETGVEPATSSLGSWHSTTELLPHLGKSSS